MSKYLGRTGMYQGKKVKVVVYAWNSSNSGNRECYLLCYMKELSDCFNYDQCKPIEKYSSDFLFKTVIYYDKFIGRCSTMFLSPTEIEQRVKFDKIKTIIL